MPVAARPRSASSRTAASGTSPDGRVEEEEGEDRDGDQLEDDQVDEERARLGGEEDGAVDRGQPDRVEAALLALGDEEAVDRRAARRRAASARARRRRGSPSRLVRSSPKRKMTKVVTAKSAIAGSDCSVRSSTRRSLREDRGEAGGHREPPATERPRPAVAAALAVVGDDDAGAAVAGADQRRDQLAGLGVEVGVGLVEQQQLRLVQDGAADREPLPHPGRELGDPLVGAAAPCPTASSSRSIRASAGRRLEPVQARREARGSRGR